MLLTPPTVVNIKSTPHEIYIGLGSPWGNPYSQLFPRNQAIKSFEKRLRTFIQDPGWRVELKALAGKTLGCHCSPQPCHGDIIVKLFLELYGIDGTMVVGNPNAMATTVRGMGPESQFRGPVRWESIRGAGVSDIPEEVDLGSVRKRQSWVSGQSRASEETRGNSGGEG